MALEFVCPCGCALSVSENDAGLPVSCPTCFGDVTAPGDPLRPWNRHERGTVLSSAVGGAPPANEPDNPLAFVGPGEMARERDRAVRAAEAAAWYETPNHREPKFQPHGPVWGLLLMGFAVVWGASLTCIFGPSNRILYGTVIAVFASAAVCFRGPPAEPTKKSR